MQLRMRPELLLAVIWNPSWQARRNVAAGMVEDRMLAILRSQDKPTSPADLFDSVNKDVRSWSLPFGATGPDAREAYWNLKNQGKIANTPDNRVILAPTNTTGESQSNS